MSRSQFRENGSTSFHLLQAFWLRLGFVSLLMARRKALKWHKWEMKRCGCCAGGPQPCAGSRVCAGSLCEGCRWEQTQRAGHSTSCFPPCHRQPEPQSRKDYCYEANSVEQLSCFPVSPGSSERWNNQPIGRSCFGVSNHTDFQKKKKIKVQTPASGFLLSCQILRWINPRNPSERAARGGEGVGPPHHRVWMVAQCNARDRLWQCWGQPWAGAEHCAAWRQCPAPLCPSLPAQLGRLSSSARGWQPHRLALGFRFEQINELQGKLQKQHNLQTHKVLKEKSATKRTPGPRKGKKFLLLYTDLCKAQNTLTWAAVCHALTQTYLEWKEEKILQGFTFRLCQ